MIPVNYLAVLGVAVVGFVFGALWHGPLFGKMWMRLSGISDAEAKTMKEKGMPNMGRTFFLSFVAQFLTSVVITYALIFTSAYLSISPVSAGLMAAFWTWLGFVVPTSLNSVLWEKRTWSLWCFNSTYYLVLFFIMGVLLGLWA